MAKILFAVLILALPLHSLYAMKTSQDNLSTVRLEMDIELANLIRAYILGIPLSPPCLAKIERLQAIEREKLVNIMPENTF